VSEVRTYASARPGLRTRVADRISRRSRGRRAELFRRLIGPQPGERAVDVGCGAAGLAVAEPELEVTGVDIGPMSDYPGARFVQADATALPFGDCEFDIAYSNSVIEHLPADAREAYAREVRRVAARWFVQTPNRAFPVEPHSLLPFVHWLPRPVGRLLWRFGVSGDPYDDVRLLGGRELRRLFPDAVIARERTGPLTKSLVAAGPRDGITRGS